MKIGRYSIEITHPEKVMFPEQGLTKEAILNFYLSIDEFILPHLKNRPLMLQRFPNGIGEKGFYQKDASDYFPDWIPLASLKKEGGTVDHVLCNNKSVLAYLVNQGTISFHTWLSQADQPNFPDKFIIDLDPPGDDFEQVRKAARLVKKLLDEIGVESFLMTTGSSGLHIVVALDAKSEFEESREFGKSIGNILTQEHPSLFTLEKQISKRGDRIYFDVQRNAYAQTAIAPYSLRPRPTAPVATPISWDELNNKKLHSGYFNIANLSQRLTNTEDPWLNFRKHRTSVRTLAKKLQSVT